MQTFHLLPLPACRRAILAADALGIVSSGVLAAAVLAGAAADPRRFLTEAGDASWLDMADANAEDGEVMGALDALTLGQSVSFGGGAAPVSTVTRIA